jgi:outer membrane cobalamin receptor
MGNRVTDPFDLPGTRLPGFAVVDLTTAWSLASQLRLHVGVLNLLDKSYRLRPEFSQPERAFIVGLRVAWIGSGSGG